MKEKLRIGISSGWESGQLVEGWPLIYTIRNLVQVIEREGHIHYVLPVLDKPTAPVIEEMLGILDGVILSGEVLSIKRNVVNELKTNILRSSNPLRYDNEASIILAARKRKLSILGICRGFQVMAMELGGEVLDGDVNINNYIIHQQGTLFPPTKAVHTINIMQGSLLHQLLGKDRVMVNSFHRQAVLKVPNNFSVSAISEDEVIEGMESRHGSIQLGLQFHPEMLPEKIWGQFFHNWLILIGS